MGATRRFVTLHFYAVVAILGLIGAAIGLLMGVLLEMALPVLLRGLLPPDVELTLTARSLVEGMLLGGFVVVAFTFFPLYQLGQLRPNFIFRKEAIGIERRGPYIVTLLLILGAFVAMVLWLLGDVRTSLYFVGAVLGLVGISALLTEATLWGLRRLRLRSLPLRQALRGLFRPRNPTRAIIITLSTSLAVLFCIFLVEQTLDASFVASYPEDTPNVFFLDIQPDQLAEFRSALGEESEYFPVIRSTIIAINDAPPNEWNQDEREEGGTRRENGRDFQFSLTYRDGLLEGESVADGAALFDDEFEGVQVSVLDEVLDFAGVELGDLITFRIQGVPLDATVTSIRTRNQESVEPFFSFVFPSADLQDAPQTIFTALRVDEAIDSEEVDSEGADSEGTVGEAGSRIAALQNRIVAQFPNVSVIDVSAAIETFSGLARRITRVIRFFTTLSIVAGLLIVVSAVFATRFARIQEAAYYKVLGAKRSFVLWVFTAENLLLGLVSALLGLAMAQVGSWLINTRLLELDYRPFVGASAVMVLATMLLVTAVGMAASVSILRSKPIQFLREQTEEE